MNFKILKVLLYKNFLIRKRRWKSCLFFEVLLPLLFVYGLWKLKDGVDLSDDSKISPEQAYEAKKLDYRYYSLGVLYAPNNGDFEDVMDYFRDCVTRLAGRQSPNADELKGFATEEEALSYHASIPDRRNKIVVIFKPRYINSKSLNYKIRHVDLNTMKLYENPREKSPHHYYNTYTYNFILQTQVCLDWSYMKTINSSIEFDQTIYTQQFPTLECNTSGRSYHYINFISMTFFIIFGISLLSETLRASKEKFLGVHVLMAINGVSNSINLLSWLISGVFFVFLFVAIPTIIIFSTAGELPSFFAYGKTSIIVLTFFLYVVHLLIFGIHVSAYFKKALYVTFALLTVNFGPIIFLYYDVINKVFLPYLGIIFPSLLFTRALQEIEFYELHKIGMQWKLLFHNGDKEYGFAGCLGIVLILFVLGINFHFLMAIYIYEINPGKYGTSKHPLFFIQQFLSKSTISQDAEVIERKDKRLFEDVNQEIYRPGIQIRNLKKTYDLGIFNRFKVHALKDVSIDFYKGQITSLLGHNGAGKTTLMSILTGMTSPTGGSIFVNSRDLKYHGNDVMNNMGLCTQENMMFPNLSVGEQLLIFAMMKGEKKSKEIKKNIRTMLHKIKLYEKRNVLPSDLSVGQKRRLGLGMALIGDSNVLILDEPTSGLDPENRRVIWDILLKLKGSKTILISTHDMEEADILGDRIAILHGGKLRSYGTPFFLKKILGEGNVEVTLSVDPSCETREILQEFNSDTKIINEDGGKIVLSMKTSSNLPDVLDKIEVKKSELGITGMSVSLLTLEQVFLKVTEEKDSRSGQVFDRIKRDITKKNTLQIIRGLFYKKINYTQKNIASMMGMLFYIILSSICLIMIINQKWIKEDPEEFKVQLDMYYDYDESVTFVKSNDPNVGSMYDKVTQSFSGKSYKIKESNIAKASLEYGYNNPNSYNRHVVAGAEINVNNNSYNILFSESLGYSIPVSLNLLSNVILKTQTSDDYSIGLSYQALSYNQYDNYYRYYVQNYIIAAIILVFTFSSAFALFVCHPLREALTGIKHLQKMTGASCLTYWGSMFIFDLIVYFLIVILIMTSLVITDKVMDLRVFYTKEICIFLLMFGMLGVCFLPFIYNFSFMNKPTSTVVNVIICLTIGLVILDLIGWGLYQIKDKLDLSTESNLIFAINIRKPFFLLFPQISFFHGGVKFFSTLMLNARCRKLSKNFFNSTECTKINQNEICCEFDCNDGECNNNRPYFSRDNRFNRHHMDVEMEEEYSLEETLYYQFCTAILYFMILGIFETKLFQQLFARTKKILRNIKKLESPDNNQVRAEKIAVAEKIAELTGNNLTTVSTNSSDNIHKNLLSVNQRDNYMFLAYELQKRYGNLIAVKDVSFKVNQQECFGLLGVNGAGKSTTFRMMTGEDVLDHGSMFIGDKEFQRDKNFFLSRMGYCPQNDALIKSLNSYDHLRLFARLRSIPENEIEHEVNLWIQRLNLKACATQPSGTYSGGNKRRLNIAIALIGIPEIVLMDEPTTGVDPGARRSLWSVIQSCQATGQAVILTSHSMEECEALCNRLAIMVDGRFVCVGASPELKQRFGTDYNIQIKINMNKATDQLDSLSNDQTFRLKQDIENLLDATVTDENMGYVMYRVKPNQTSWRKMYDVMNSMKNKYECIDDFSVSSSTLEQLFLFFAKSAQNRTS